MKLRIPCRAAVLALLGAALLSACTDREPTTPSRAAPPPQAPQLTINSADSLVSLDGGENHVCGLTAAGQAWCWGRNSAGELGDSMPSYAGAPPVKVLQPSGVTFSKITAGGSHSCALTSAGQAYCWGYNPDGRLGDSTTSLGLAPVAVKPLGGVAFASISAGREHTCGLTSAGQAYCWGGGDWGQIGDNVTTFRKSPVTVNHPSGVTFASISAAGMHTCALATNGQAWCWGYGGDGALGGGFSLGDSIPVAVTQPFGVTFTSLSTEYKHACALTSGGQAYCWGKNSNGQLGNNTTTGSNTPVAVQQPSGVTFASITTGSAHTCARTSGGQAYCWGYNNNGQIGDASFVQRKTPVAVSHPSGVTFGAVSNQSNGSCGLAPTGQAWCWGKNANYQVGDGTTTDRGAPVAVLLESAPAVTGTSPADFATDVPIAQNVVVTFTEAVTVSGSSFTFTCTGGSQSFTVSGSGTNSITLDPVNPLPTLDTCTVTMIAAQVSDTDTVDGADHPTGDYPFSFTVASEFGGDP